MSEGQHNDSEDVLGILEIHLSSQLTRPRTKDD